ncbi:ABC transporter ATP-binding protein [Paraferrimonas sp. SM1919]|uniref:ABC transporter ATP-binding protein n=1 Tax=Paraferrimonas sp. SM1919 TaxID=2662263 RepID=UPI0013D3F845|nr:ABC transporter ATP-binding protein [Paraferrimonas sp. SM1919]
MSNAIEVVQLTKSVETQNGLLTILKGIDFNVNSGESVAIIGPSGSGKSTLLGLLAALDNPTSGSISLAGTDVTTLDEEQKAALRKDKTAFVFQSFMLVDSLTALENVMLPAELAGLSDAKTLAEQWLGRVGLADRLEHLPKQLSGGEQQRVALARAFISKPMVLFADEPSGNLDSVNGQKIADLLFELNQQQGTTLILVTHDQTLADRCDSQWRMENGLLSKVN